MNADQFQNIHHHLYEVRGTFRRRFLRAAEILSYHERGRISARDKVLKPEGIWVAGSPFIEGIEHISVRAFVGFFESCHTWNADKTAGKSELLVRSVFEELSVTSYGDESSVRRMIIRGRDYTLKVICGALPPAYRSRSGNADRLGCWNTNTVPYFGAIALQESPYLDARDLLLNDKSRMGGINLCWEGEEDSEKRISEFIVLQ